MTDDKTDQIKGRAKEAAGALTGDDDLKREGQADQRAGEAKSKVDEVADKVKDAIDDAADRIAGS